ncbi:MAG: GHKL domain-containing protein [Oscillibacter sp.]|nr:GHKL domain-containing protein [Oscillibacter sp.]
MDVFSCCLDFFYLAGLSVLHLVFVGRLVGKHAGLRWFVLYCAILCGLQVVFTLLDLGELPAIGAELLALYAMVRTALRVRRPAAWTATLLAVYISQLSFGLVNSVEAMLIPWGVNGLLLRILLILFTIAALAVCACCYWAVLKFLSLAENSSAPYAIVLLPTLFFFFAELYILKTAYSILVVPPAPAEWKRHTALLLLQALGLAALLCTAYAYRRVCRSFQTQAALASLTQAARYQKIYTAQAQMRYEKTRSFRHDLKNHLSVLSGLIQGQKWEAATSYLQKLEAASAALSIPCRTGNPVLDILLGEKLELAEAYGIKTEISLLLPENCGIDPFDLCVIFSNALDNAIAACRDLPEDKFIRITGSRRGGFYMLSFENACREGPLPPEGTGLSNIRAAAEKYHGAVSTEKTAAQFRLHVLLNISEQSDGSSCQNS